MDKDVERRRLQPTVLHWRRLLVDFVQPCIVYFFTVVNDVTHQRFVSLPTRFFFRASRFASCHRKTSTRSRVWTKRYVSVFHSFGGNKNQRGCHTGTVRLELLGCVSKPVSLMCGCGCRCGFLCQNKPHQISSWQMLVVTPADAHLCSTLTLHVHCLLRHVSTCVHMAHSYTFA